VHISGRGAGWGGAGRAPGKAPAALRGLCFSPGTRQDQTISFQERCFLKIKKKKKEIEKEKEKHTKRFPDPSRNSKY